MATSSKHDHKNVGCHRINPPPRSGDRVLATLRTPAEIYKHRKEKPQPDGAGAKFVVSEAPQASSLAHSVRMRPGVFFATCARLIGPEVKLTIEQTLPGNLSMEDWQVMREIVEAVKQAIPDAGSQPPGAVLQYVKDRLQD